MVWRGTGILAILSGYEATTGADKAKVLLNSIFRLFTFTSPYAILEGLGRVFFYIEALPSILYNLASSAWHTCFS